MAIFTQAAISLLFILTESFETILVFSGFTMGLNTFLAAGGVFLLRRRQASGRTPGRGTDSRGADGRGDGVGGSDAGAPYRTWGYPLTPLIFLAVTGWTLAYILRDRPLEAGLGLGLIAVGLGIYAVTRIRDRRTEDRRPRP